MAAGRSSKRHGLKSVAEMNQCRGDTRNGPLGNLTSPRRWFVLATDFNPWRFGLPPALCGGALTGYTFCTMRLVLDPAEEAAHGTWLRETPGAYEWWYFDAVSDDQEWALCCIWFLGSPFSPYYRQVSRGLPADPYAHNALFFALYRRGHLHAYHFTRFPVSQVKAAEMQDAETVPLCLHFGPNTLTMPTPGRWRLEIADQNANGRTLTAALEFAGPALIAGVAEGSPTGGDHSWLPALPFCRVSGTLTLREEHNPGAETLTFGGTGYHDHNWGRLPFDAAVRDWFWARAALPGERSVVLYHVRPRHGAPVSHLLLFESGHLLFHDAGAQVRLDKPALNGFGTRYPSRLTAAAPDFSVRFQFGSRLDSSPFYVRALCDAEVVQNGKKEHGHGIGEYLRPRPLGGLLAASAMRARMVER